MDEKKQKRHFIRFNPDALDVAVLSLKAEDFLHYDENTFQFNGDIVGLIYDQSYNGCNVLLVNKKNDPDFMPVGYRCVLKVGKLDPLRATTRWKEEIAPGIFKVGFEILD